MCFTFLKRHSGYCVENGLQRGNQQRLRMVVWSRWEKRVGLKMPLKELLTGLAMDRLDVGVSEKEKSKVFSEWEKTSLPEMGKIPGELPMRPTRGATCHVADLQKPWECLCPPKSSSSAPCLHVNSKCMCVRVADTHTLAYSHMVNIWERLCLVNSFCNLKQM